MPHLTTHFPLEREEELYNLWEEHKAFLPNDTKSQKKFSIIMPPPNITGILHVGHALDTTLQDILIRYHRMKGDKTLWLPGMDHAGIATQMVVEKELEKTGIQRTSLSREEFAHKVQDWKQHSSSSIYQQLRSLGASCDWSKSSYTLDPYFQNLVQDVFIDLYEKGLIYKATRLVNWDTKLQTAISDLEVLWKNESGYLWTIDYPLVDQSGYISISTTRPETLFGDTAVAVSPKDNRYTAYIGKYVHVPLTNRTVPIIADDYVDITKGTGGLKVTPAHDFNDYAIGKRHNLPIISVIDSKGIMNEKAKPVQRLSVLDARKKVLSLLEEHQLLRDSIAIEHPVPVGDRSNTVIEPMITDQWFMNVKPLAKEAINALEKNHPNFIPKNWQKIYATWLHNIEPWCISRQLWWGHRIPIWYGPDYYIFVAKNQHEAEEKAFQHYGKSVDLTQEKDVLDTWFSSALWPLGTVHWNPHNQDHTLFQTFYPHNVLVTGFDIIFFWVARMTMMGIHYTKQIPFQHVYIHPLIRDQFGQKMSKSKGNTLNPIDLIQQFGCDALRFSLTQATTFSQDVRFSPKHVEYASRFVNKIWNMAKYIDFNLQDHPFTQNTQPFIPKHPINQAIVLKTQSFVYAITNYLEAFRFSEYANTLYSFIWHDFCDQYLELSKILLQSTDQSIVQDTKNTLFHILRYILTVAHPVMPFVSEELWQHFFSQHSKKPSYLINSTWPNFPVNVDMEENSKENKNILQVYDHIIYTIKEIRSLRSLLNISPKTIIPAHVQGDIPDRTILYLLCNLQDVTKHANHKNSHILNVAYDSKTIINLYIQENDKILAGIAHLKKQQKNINKDIEFYKKKLSNPSFLNKAPKQAIQDAKSILGKLQNEQNELNHHLHVLQS